MSLSRTIIGLWVLVAVLRAGLCAQDSALPSCESGQSLEDAWWTGPMLAPSAATLPRGHFLIEPYLFDVITQGSYDSNGTRHSAPHANGFGSLTYMLYGVANKFTVGMIPVAGYNTASTGPSSSGVGIGDLTLQAQYRLTQFRRCHWMPTTSFAVQETLPTGQYDRLGDRLADGFGSGTFTTTLAFYSQKYFWLPNGRILRMRFNVLPAFSTGVNVHDASVYGTTEGFRGRAQPGKSLFVDASWEYSLSRSWVIATDATYRYAGNTVLTGSNVLSTTPNNLRMNSGSSDAFGLAPAIEYSWKGTIGVLLGVRLIPAGRNAASTITPAIAINYVH